MKIDEEISERAAEMIAHDRELVDQLRDRYDEINETLNRTSSPQLFNVTENIAMGLSIAINNLDALINMYSLVKSLSAANRKEIN